MAVRVLESGLDAVSLTAELEPNLNHRATAFGGSVAALAILTGWSYVHVRLRCEGIEMHTVIHESHVHYDLPIERDFSARCERPDEVRWARFVRALSRHGKGRVRLAVTVSSGGRDVARFEGAYVALDEPR